MPQTQLNTGQQQWVSPSAGNMRILPANISVQRLIHFTEQHNLQAQMPQDSLVPRFCGPEVCM